MMDKVSIIVPIFNVEKYLKKCLESLKAQTYKNIEVIMINDGSTDASAQIAMDFGSMDERFVYVEKENGGLSSARNMGLEYATGSFVGFLDSDDWVQPKFVEELMQYFDDEIDIVIGRHRITDITGKQEYIPVQYAIAYGKYSGVEKSQYVFKPMVMGDSSLMSVWRNIYRRDLIACTKFVSEREIYEEDYYFNVMMYDRARSVYMAGEANVMHLIVPDSLSQGYRENRFAMMQQKNSLVEKYLMERHPKLLQEYQSGYAGEVAGVILNLCKSTWKTSVSNVNNVLSDLYTKQIISSNNGVCMLTRYLPIYYSAKYFGTYPTVLICKIMLACEPLYRFVNKQKEKCRLIQK